MKAVVTAIVAVVLAGGSYVAASGPVGIYGIVDRVVFEPSTGTPERVQVWGTFAYVEPRLSTPAAPAMSAVERGFLYFTLPSADGPTASQRELVSREWADLSAVAGTGQAVGFGQWGYIGRFEDLQPAGSDARPPRIFERVQASREPADMRVRPAGETPARPVVYQTNAGVVKLAAQGSHAEVVRRLRAATPR